MLARLAFSLANPLREGEAAMREDLGHAKRYRISALNTSGPYLRRPNMVPVGLVQEELSLSSLVKGTRDTHFLLQRWESAHEIN